MYIYIYTYIYFYIYIHIHIYIPVYSIYISTRYLYTIITTHIDLLVYKTATRMQKSTTETRHFCKKDQAIQELNNSMPSLQKQGTFAKKTKQFKN